MPAIEIEDLKRIKLADDEVLLVRVDCAKNPGRKQLAEHALRNIFPANRVIITDMGVEFSVIKKPGGDT